MAVLYLYLRSCKLRCVVNLDRSTGHGLSILHAHPHQPVVLGTECTISAIGPKFNHVPSNLLGVQLHENVALATAVVDVKEPITALDLAIHRLPGLAVGENGLAAIRVLQYS